MAGLNRKGNGEDTASLGSYMVSGRTQIYESHVSQHDGESYSSRKFVEQYIVDRSQKAAKEQFKLIYPGSTAIKARFIKAL